MANFGSDEQELSYLENVFCFESALNFSRQIPKSWHELCTGSLPMRLVSF